MRTYNIGDVIQFDGVNGTGSKPYTTYFLITHVDIGRDYEVLCLQSNDVHQYGWKRGEQGKISKQTINTYGIQVI